MATIPPTQPISTITPPSSSHGDMGIWEYAVPLDHNENPGNRDYKHHDQAVNNSSVYPSSRQPLSQQQNGISKYNSTSRTDYIDSAKMEGEYLAPARGNALRNKTSDLSNGSADPDGAELSKPPSASESRNGSRSGSYSSSSRQQVGTRKSSGQLAPQKQSENDESYWIHRDKLREIESRELEEAGFRLSRRTSDRQDQNYKRDEKRQRLASPVRMDEEAEDSVYEIRNPDEASSTPPKSFIPKPAGGRQGGSRIPKPRGSAVQSPSPASGNEKGSPGTRSRNGSGAWNNGVDQSPKSQAKSRNTQTNGKYADDDENDGMPLDPQTPPLRAASLASSNDRQTSPPKARVPTKGPTARKTSTATRNVSSAKVRTPSTAKQSTEAKRPGTSSGNTPRPSTSHRIEGDPPWIASMYKPDPRLPPDQQMLPTHAKRLAQEQWEKEGKTGTVYDRDFNLLNTQAFPSPAHPLPSPQTSPSKSALDSSPNHGTSLARDEKLTVLTPTWPLNYTPPLGSPRSTNSRPGTSGTEHGGYKTMPTITAQPHSPQAVGGNQPQPAVQPIRVMDVPEEQEKREKKGCCGGCVVM